MSSRTTSARRSTAHRSTRIGSRTYRPTASSRPARPTRSCSCSIHCWPSSCALRRRPYDVIHAHHAEGLLAAASARLRLDVPIVYDVHTLLHSELPYYRMGLSRSVLAHCGAYLDRRLPQSAEHVIAVSEDIRTHLTASGRVASDRVSLIPNGVED